MSRAAGRRRQTMVATLLALVLLVVSACAPAARTATDAGRGAASGTVAPSSVPVFVPVSRLVVLPDDGVESLTRFFDAARQQLDLYVFELTDPAAERSLVEAARRGVRVRTIVEPEPSGRAQEAREAMTRLRKAGIQVKPAGRPFSATHAKSFIADGARAWIGTANLTDKGERRRDYAVITERPATVAAVARLFEQDWVGLSSALRLPGTGSVDPKTNLVISPANGRPAITQLFSAAERTLYLEEAQLDDTAIIDLLAKRSKAGVDVQVVLPNNASGQRAAKALWQRSPEIQVRLLDEPEVHAKLAIADEQRALVGSHNLTKESLDSRREVGLLVDDAPLVAALVEVFRRDFDGVGATQAPLADPVAARTSAQFLWGFLAGVLATCGAGFILGAFRARG